MRKAKRTATRLLVIAQKIRLKLFPPAPPPPPVPLPAADGDIGNKVVVITGASGGIGAALAAAFAQRGARVVINARDQAKLDAILEKLSSAASQTLSITADVSTESGARKLIDGAISEFGGVDVLINNAGSAGPGDQAVWETDSQQWQQIIASNLFTAIHCTQAASTSARARARPLRVINVSSGIVGHGMKNLGPYAVTKEALDGLTRAYACDGEDLLVSTVSIQPRSVRSAMTQSFFDTATYNLMDEPEVLADTFIWAATAPSAQIQGKTISEPLFAADRPSAVVVRGTLAAAPPIAINPETFIPESNADLAPGAHMHLLENAHGYYPSAAKILEDNLHDRRLYSYPDPAYLKLKQAIASETGLSTDNIALGAGSSEVIDRILQIFCKPGDDILITKPTWSFFHAFAQRWQVIPRRVPMTGSLREGTMRHNLPALLAGITPLTRLVYLVNPCNPSGSVLPAQELRDFVAQLPPHVTMLLDEAYIQYCAPDARPDVAELLDICPARLIVLRTFSKFFGMSGHRLGYACATKETVGLLAKGEMPFAITTAAATIAPAVLADTTHRELVYSSNREGYEQLTAGLKELGIPFLPSQTNFILYECPTTPQRVREEAKAQGLILPDVDQFIDNFALLAVGKPEHNNLLLEILRKF